jgi:hypothetical protein
MGIPDSQGQSCRLEVVKDLSTVVGIRNRVFCRARYEPVTFIGFMFLFVLIVPNLYCRLCSARTKMLAAFGGGLHDTM